MFVCLAMLPLVSWIVRGSAQRQMPDLMAEEAESDSPAAREAELRQMLEAKAYRQAERGEEPIDVEAELRRLLAGGEPRT